MKRKIPFLLASLTALAIATSSADTVDATAAFSDPSQTGRFQARLMHGEVLIQGADVDEVSVITDAKRNAQENPRDDDMRVLSSGVTFSLIEKDNVMTLDYGSGAGWTDPANFVITVPHDTHLDIEVSIGGEIEIADVSGNVAIKNLNGEIQLINHAGGALVESMNGEIDASFTQLHPDRPLSFSSMNGEIELHLPADAQANVRFRTQNGTILTNFSDEEMQTTTTAGRAFAPEAHEEIAEFAAEMAEGAIEMAMEIAVEVREAMVEAREEMRAAEKEMRQAEKEIREAEKVMEKRQREAAEVVEVVPPTPPNPAAAPPAPRAPRPPSIPSMAGGKVVSGTLNGGGVDIQVATMNGDILIRKSDN